jgi:uncharacterized protein (TIGR03437 family)
MPRNSKQPLGVLNRQMVMHSFRSVRFHTFLLFVLLSATVFAQTSMQSHRTPPMSNHYAVILSEPAVLDRFSTRESTRSLAAQGYRQQIEAHQLALQTELESRRFQVIGSVSTTANAIFVVSTPDRVAELQSLPGVAGVTRMRIVQPRLNRATALMNAPAAWAALGGVNNAGKGLKVAVIDSGIDQTHPAFQDPTLTMPAGFPLCTANHPEDCAYTTSKVIVARSYVRQESAPSDPKNPAADSSPDDPSPRDRIGHGTAVASVIGAVQNSGPTLGFNGIAPKVYLGNYKVLSPVAPATEDAAVMAITDAFNDGFDIANLSLGVLATTGPLDTGAACGNPVGVACDLLASSAEKAAQGGMLIAVAVGNDGYSSGNGNYPTYGLTSSPANAPSVIAVGGTLNDHVFNPAVSVPGGPSNLQKISAQTSDAYSSLAGASSAPLVDVSTIGNDGYACTALPAFSLYNSYALIERGPAGNTTCTFNLKATNAVNAGAIGIVFYMYDSTPPIPIELQDSAGNAPPLFAPVVMIANADGLNLKSYLASHPGATVLIDPAGVEVTLAAYNQQFGFSPALAGNQFVGFSSPGPDPGDFSIKPDMVATAGGDQANPFNSPDPNDFYFFGQSGMYLAVQSYDPGAPLYSPNRYAAYDGTSFASPLVAGAAALVMQAHPSYTIPQVRSALVNSAAQDTTADDAGFNVNAIQLGAGRLNAGAAVAATVAASPVSISYGNIKGGTLPINKAIQLTNLGSATANLTIAVSKPIDVNLSSPSGLTVAVDKSTLSLTAGASGTITVSLSGTVPTAGGQYAGTVTVTGGASPVSIPYILMVASGTIYDLIPVQFGQVATFSGCFEGLPGEDVGPVSIKLIDSFGVPVTGSPVQFSISPRGSVTLASVPGEPACSPATTGTATTCNTDNYGFAYAEVTMGSSISSSPTITARAGGMSFAFGGQGCGVIIAQPNITGVSEAAVGSPNIAPGSYISIYGSNLVNPNNVVAVAPAFGDSAAYLPLPLMLDGVTVSFDVPGAYDGKPIDYNGVPGYFTFVGNAGTQLNLQIPWELQGKSSVQVKVTVDGTAFSNVLTVPLVQYSPQLFQNSGQVAAIDATTYAAHPTPISPSNPAHVGDTVELFANGLGPVNNQPNSGEGASATPSFPQTKSPVTVTIGGQNAPVGYAGLAPGYPGLYQINITVPPGVAAGNPPVIISVGGQNSKSATIPIQ